MKVVEKKNAKGTDFVMQFDPENKLILIKRHGEDPSFAIGFLIDGTWHYQWLMWSCRAGKAFWYRPLIAFYRHIRKNQITDYSLRFLACGDQRLKHTGGYAIGTESHRSWKAIGERLVASRNREATIKVAIRDMVTAIDLSDRWTLEIGSNDFYVLNERTPAVGMKTSCINIKVVFDSIFIQEITGISTRPNDPDPFRNMKLRHEQAPLRIADPDRTADDLVAEAMKDVATRMAERCEAVRSEVKLAA